MPTYYKAWLPDGDAKALVLLVHGLGSHCQRTMNVVQHFIGLGVAVYGLDHVGHGLSAGEREMIDDFSDYTLPLYRFLTLVKGWHRPIPIFLYGHSLGGLIACCHLLEHQAEYRGAILSSPALRVGALPVAWLAAIARLLSSIRPRMGLININAKASYLCSDHNVVSDYKADPLVFHGSTPARLCAEMLGAMEIVARQAATISLPLFIFQGSADRIVDPAGAPMLYAAVSSVDKTLKIYPGLLHEIHNEPDRAILFQDLEGWLQAHLP